MKYLDLKFDDYFSNSVNFFSFSKIRNSFEELHLLKELMCRLELAGSAYRTHIKSLMYFYNQLGINRTLL